MLYRIINAIDLFTEKLGRLAAWFAPIMVLVTCYIVVTRYVFNTGSIAIQETVIYLNALLFMLCASYTLKHNGHVRVDIFYNNASDRYKEWVNFLGSLLLLLPVSLFIFLSCWDYVVSSWVVKEQSGEAGGLRWVYLLKSLILVLSAGLVIQGVAEILRNALLLFSPKEKGHPLEEESGGNAL